MVLCPDHHAVFSALALVLNQRLVRQLCRQCAGRGCPACLQSGYRGRVAVAEWFRVGEDARKKLCGQGLASVQPAETLQSAMARLAQSGVTSTAEIERVLGSGAGPTQSP